jgi:hypothetical protein
MQLSTFAIHGRFALAIGTGPAMTNEDATKTKQTKTLTALLFDMTPPRIWHVVATDILAGFEKS